MRYKVHQLRLRDGDVISLPQEWIAVSGERSPQDTMREPLWLLLILEVLGEEVGDAVQSRQVDAERR